MSFYEKYEEVKSLPFEEIFTSTTEFDVKRVLAKSKLTEMDFLTLLSPAAEAYLEEMAVKAHNLTVQHFGSVMQLFSPLYLSDYCVNQCKYCSFSIENQFERKRLTMDEVEGEAKAIAARGIRHVILLTGESRRYTPISYFKESVGVFKNYFDSLSIEVQPLTVGEYKEVIAAGIDGLTVFQEVYNEDIYKEIHLKGPKRNYHFRLNAPERGCQAGMRTVTIGALLGLDDWRKEAFFTGLHAAYLQNKYLETVIGVALPRIKPHLGSFQPNVHVLDKHLVQYMLALRLFLPRIGMTLSTREAPKLRDHLIPLGITQMSAGSSTAVGGYAEEEEGNSQFEISDERSVDEIKSLLKQKGYQPVFKDWQLLSEAH
ncbi:2-iminoacetate synthase ThiH [Bacillus taeanensis]|uniref:2-iminoacetate synthase ThiH n=1 Tax=Bacillus taeanensis TaxID=273032 RepID=A0A366XW49_9BACI|nr:2-iminoacetate synthase ThiH [Bacillus taeanensis]RBW68364.1 2-iminoacetate synthase ThiH [Bacillus taeanensis]